MKRRNFLQTAGAAATAFTIIPRHVMGGNGFVAPNDKITLAHIGCGTQGFAELGSLLACPDIQITAVCDPEKDGRNYVGWLKGMTAATIRGLLNDPDWRRGIDYIPGGRDVAKEVVDTYYSNNRAGEKFKGVIAYADFRELFEKESVDAIKIMTPDHLHGVIALQAMKKGIHVAAHKPLSNKMFEIKKVIETTRQTKVATYFMPWMNTRSIAQTMEWINEGAIGTLKEVHNWSNRPVWPQYLEKPTSTPPVPEGFDWDLWLGPEAYRPYSPDYTHTVFRGWYDFGAGAIADMGHYSLWAVFDALDLDAPICADAFGSHACKIQNFSSITIKNDFSYPLASTMRFTFSAKGNRPAIDLIWYDGGMRPTVIPELEEDNEPVPAEGMLFVGDRGKIITSFIPDDSNSRIIPRSKMKAFTGKEWTRATNPRSGGDAGSAKPVLPKDMDKWLEAIKRGDQNNPGNFVSAQALAETLALGTVALRSGRKIDYNSAKMEIANYPEANKYFTRDYRKGWEI